MEVLQSSLIKHVEDKSVSQSGSVATRRQSLISMKDLCSCWVPLAFSSSRSHFLLPTEETCQREQQIVKWLEI